MDQTSVDGLESLRQRWKIKESMDLERGLSNKSDVRSQGSSSIDYDSWLYVGNTGENSLRKKEDQKFSFEHINFKVPLSLIWF